MSNLTISQLTDDSIEKGWKHRDQINSEQFWVGQSSARKEIVYAE